jgi:hypothetical protein
MLGNIILLSVNQYILLCFQAKYAFESRLHVIRIETFSEEQL